MVFLDYLAKLLAVIFLCIRLSSVQAERRTPETNNWFEADGIEAVDEPSNRDNSTLKASINATLNQDSNITQLPDGETSVLGKEGAHSVYSLTLKMHNKPEKKGEKKLTAVFKLGQSRYNDSILSTRDSQNITIGLEKMIKRPKNSRFMAFTLKANYRFDFLYAFGGREKGFETFTPGILGIVKPKKIKNAFMDIFIHVLGLDLESRNFINKFGVDGNGKSKDSFTPSLTNVFLTMKKHQHFNSKNMIIVNFRNSLSDSPDLEYYSSRLSYVWTANISNFDLSPDIVYSMKNQNSYQSAKPRDEKFEAGLNCKFVFNKKKSSLSGQFRYSEQSSNVRALEYQNKRFSLNLSHSL